MRRHSIQRLLTVPLWASAFVLTGLIIMQFSRRHAA